MQNNSTAPNRIAAVDARVEQGFSLLELIIAMVVFMIVTGAAYGVMQVAQRSRTVVSQQVQLTKNVRVALNLIGRDTYNAGFGYPLRNSVVLPDNRISTIIGVPVDVNSAPDTVPPLIAGNGRTLNTFNTAPNVRTDQVTFLFKDSTFNEVGAAGSAVSQPLIISTPTTVGGVDEFTVPAPAAGTPLSIRVNDILIVNGGNGSTLGMVSGINGTTIRFANGDALGFNQTGEAGPLRLISMPAGVQRVQMVTYYVTAGGVLMRREFANVAPPAPAAGFVDEPLVYGVEDFQIQYVLNDGSLSDNPSAGANGVAGDADDVQANLSKVRQVRFTVSVRSTELDQNGQPYRATVVTTFSTRNLGYNVR